MNIEEIAQALGFCGTSFFGALDYINELIESGMLIEPQKTIIVSTIQSLATSKDDKIDLNALDIAIHITNQRRRGHSNTQKASP